MDRSVSHRKRTARACDQCRRRKAKCSGTQSCNGCNFRGLDCSFESNGRRRGPAHIAHLDQTVKGLDQKVTPGPSANIGDAEIRITLRRGSADSSYNETLAYQVGDYSSVAPLGLYGCCSGIEILRRMRANIDSTVGLRSSTPSIYALTNSLDRPVPELCSPPSFAFRTFSPSKEDLLRHMNVAFEQDVFLWSFVDRDSVEATIHCVYDTTSTLSSSSQDEMALIYAIAAIGEYLDTEAPPASTSEMDEDSEVGGDSELNEKGWHGLACFRAAHSLVKLSTCERSMLALQTTVCMTIYLVATSAMTRAQLFIKIAGAAAVRQRLDVTLGEPSMTTYEDIQRKRTFRSIKAIDALVTTFLGLPCSLSLHGLDSGQGTLEFEWESIAASRSVNHAEIAADACIEAFAILCNANQAQYFSGSQPKPRGYYSVPHSSLRHYNRRLDYWSLGVSSLQTTRKLQLLLRQTGNYVKMVYNSPFIHYLNTQWTALEHHDGQSSAAKCVIAAIDTVEVMRVLKEERMLNFSHSSTLRSLAFAAMVLLVVELGDHEVQGIEPVKMASNLAEDLLKDMAMRHVAALGCFQSLRPLYELKHWIQVALPTPDLTTCSTRATSSCTTLPTIGDEISPPLRPPIRPPVIQTHTDTAV